MIDMKNKFLEIMQKCKTAVLSFINNLSLEVICKISIVLFIFIIGVLFFTNSQSRANKTIADVFHISDNIRQFYIGKPNFWGLNTQTVVKEKIIDSKYIVNDKIITAKGLAILVGKGFNADTLMFLDNTFDIVINDLDKSNCISLLEADIAKENVVRLREILLKNTNGIFSFRWGDDKYSLPVKKYIAKDICSDVNNSLLWSVE